MKVNLTEQGTALLFPLLNNLLKVSDDGPIIVLSIQRFLAVVFIDTHRLPIYKVYLIRRRVGLVPNP